MTEFQSAILLAQLERLPGQMELRKENIAYLRNRLAEVRGIEVLAEKPEVTRQGMYCLSLNMDSGAFSGMPRDVLVDALEAEGIPVIPPYEVVYKSVMWKPGEKLWKFPEGKDPRSELGLDVCCPVTERVSFHTGLVLNHRMFLGDQSDMDDIADAFLKVQESAADLKWKSLNKRMRFAARKVLGKV